jgi:hypothetical protein
MCHVTI